MRRDPQLRETFAEHAAEQREIAYENRQESFEALVRCIAITGSLQVRTLDLEYKAGGFSMWNGVKGGGNRGYGWSSTSWSSKLLLSVEGPIGPVKRRVERWFKAGIGPLTGKRRTAIRKAMPPLVTLVMGVSPWTGREVIEVEAKEMAAWIAEAAGLLPRKSSHSSNSINA